MDENATNFVTGPAVNDSWQFYFLRNNFFKEDLCQTSTNIFYKLCLVLYRFHRDLTGISIGHVKRVFISLNRQLSDGVKLSSKDGYINPHRVLDRYFHPHWLKKSYRVCEKGVFRATGKFLLLKAFPTYGLC